MEDIRVGILQVKEDYSVLKFRKEQGRKGLTPCSVGSISPHKVWLSISEKDIKKISNNSEYSFDKIVEIMNRVLISKEEVDKLFDHVLKYGKDVAIQGVNAASVYITLANAKEFYLSHDTVERITNNISNGNYRKTLATIKDFDLPFEEIAITAKDNKNNRKYDYFFISVFKHLEKYCNKDGKFEDVFTIKECLINESGTREAITTELNIVPSLLPRVFIDCKQMNTCKNCIEVNFAKNFEFYSLRKNNVSPSEGFKCKKSIRNSHMCDNLHTADKAMQLLYTVSEILKQYKKKPIKIPKYSSGESQNTIHQAHEKDESIIYMTGKTYTYVDCDHKRIRNKGGHHDSPCEHERSEHFRRCKSGKVVPVKSSKVNEGGKKSKVVI